MRELRDTAVINIIDWPTVLSKPEPRGRGIQTLLGFLIGAGVGALLVVLREMAAKRRAEGDPATHEFVSAMDEVKGEMMRRMRRLTGRATI